MKSIVFAGIKGRIIKSSPHGNYLVVELSDRITICGTFSNQFNWDESPDASSGFESFITYVGVEDDEDVEEVREMVETADGFFYAKEPRPSKRVAAWSNELKIHGLTSETVAGFVQDLAS